jgi:hypothetical protein
MKMNLLKTAVLAFISSCAFAQAPTVTADLLGTWASADADCRKLGPSTLTISQTSVLRHDVRGSIINGRGPGRRSIEVFFEGAGGGQHALGVRMYTLAVDGSALLEMLGNGVVETRRRCKSAIN